jgi:hypothetical protein
MTSKSIVSIALLSSIFIGGGICGYAIASNYNGKLEIQLGASGVLIHIDGTSIISPKVLKP